MMACGHCGTRAERISITYTGSWYRWPATGEGPQDQYGRRDPEHDFGAAEPVHEERLGVRGRIRPGPTGYPWTPNAAAGEALALVARPPVIVDGRHHPEHARI